ncbi:MAG: hypothetical protein ACYDHO_07165 [Gaiellaceae bacterium]
MSERRTTVYLVGLGLLFFFFLILAAFLGRDYLVGSADERAWVKQNDLVLAALPTYPGAIEVSAPYSKREPRADAASGKRSIRGYQTTHTYAWPLGAGPDLVLSFYREQLGEWTLESVQGSGCDLTFRRDRAMLDLTVCSGNEFTLSVDYTKYE